MSTGGFLGMRFDSATQMQMDPKVEVEFLRARLKEMEAVFQMAQQKPQRRAIVLEVRQDKTTIAIGPHVEEVATPTRIPDLGCGDIVHILPDSEGILDRIEDSPLTGPIMRVVRRIDDRYIEAEGRSGVRVISLAGKHDPQEGDRVILDGAAQICVRIVDRAHAVKVDARAIETGVTWDDIGGQDEAKKALREAIEGVVLDADRYKRYRKRMPKGALLVGPPGCGKSLFAKAAATAIAELHGKASAATGFQHVKGPEILQKFVGESEQAVRDLFETAREHKKRHGYPSIICLDEADALLAARGRARMEGMEKTIVPAFLTEMDGIEDSGAFVLLLTNRPDILDSAVVREKRCDLKIHVGRPDKKQAAEILRLHLKDVPISIDLDDEDDRLAVGAGVASDELFSPRHGIYVVRTRSARADKRLNLSHFVSGAMCEGLVEKAKEQAIRRERETGKESGITSDDLAKAADLLCNEHRITDHPMELDEIAREFKEDLKSIDRVKP
jgi:proteasome ATPase